jgi:hypothetical protein
MGMISSGVNEAGEVDAANKRRVVVKNDDLYGLTH